MVTWPDDIAVWPRQEKDAPGDPVVEALAMACVPWRLTSLAHLLRDSGVYPTLPRRAEAEYAATLYWLVGFALNHGPDWCAEVDKAITILAPVAKAAAKERT